MHDYEVTCINRTTDKILYEDFPVRAKDSIAAKIKADEAHRTKRKRPTGTIIQHIVIPVEVESL
jgi:hypothetical protein